MPLSFAHQAELMRSEHLWPVLAGTAALALVLMHVVGVAAWFWHKRSKQD